MSRLWHYQTPAMRVPTAPGEIFSYSFARDGGVVRRLAVWVGASQVRGIRVWRSISINSPQTFGATSGSYQEFAFHDDERITDLVLLHTLGDNMRSAGFRLTTSAGRSFAPQIAPGQSLSVYPIDVASGICVGMHGREDAGELTNLGFIFLLPIVQMRMTDLRYPTLDAQVADGIQPLTVWDFREENHSHEVEKEWSNLGSFTTTESSTWAKTEGMHVYAAVSVSGRIPFIGSISAEAGWEMSESATFESGKEVSATTEWTRSGTVPPRRWLTFQVTTRKGTISLPYEASMEVTLNNDLVFTYPLRGIYSGISYTRFDIITRSGSLDDSSPQSFHIVDASSIHRPVDLTSLSSTSKLKPASTTFKALPSPASTGISSLLEDIESLRRRLGFYAHMFDIDQIIQAKGSILAQAASNAGNIGSINNDVIYDGDASFEAHEPDDIIIPNVNMNP